MSRFLSERFGSLTPYTPGEQPQNKEYIKLNTNESPYPPSPRVGEAILQSTDADAGEEKNAFRFHIPEIDHLRLYSDPAACGLVSVIAKTYKVAEEQIMVGNGSDELLAFTFLAFQDERRGVCFPDISYGFYKVFAQLFGVFKEEIPLREDFTVDIGAYLNSPHNIVLANPNAPTGLSLGLEQIELLLKSNPNRLVVMDEAYVDFGGESAVPLLKKYDNLLVIQTFSKSRNLAGARIGFALSSKEIIEDLNKIKFSFNPYNLNRLSILAGTGAMADKFYFKSCIGAIVKTREETAAKLTELGFTVIPSKANFIFTRPPGISGLLYVQKLKEKGILVRRWDREKIADYVRVTIGSKEEMEEFLYASEAILSEVSGGCMR